MIDESFWKHLPLFGLEPAGSTDLYPNLFRLSSLRVFQGASYTNTYYMIWHFELLYTSISVKFLTIMYNTQWTKKLASVVTFATSEQVMLYLNHKPVYVDNNTGR